MKEFEEYDKMLGIFKGYRHPIKFKGGNK